MEQRQENWDKKTNVIKGNFGEEIARKYLEDKGWIVYSPETKGPHCFDRLCVKNKRNMIIAEVKTKARRKFRADTGFNLKNWNEYKFIHQKYGIEIFFFFIDEFLGEMYGSKISSMMQERLIIEKGKEIKYPLIDRGIIYFPLVDMVNIQKLNAEQIEFLRNKTRTKHREYGV